MGRKCSNPWLAILVGIVLASINPIAHAEDEYLEPEVAFKFAAKMTDAKTIAVTYTVADGYYLYRERFHFKAADATLGEPVYPHGKIKFDETFQKNVETYCNSVTITLPVVAAGAFTLTSTAQGCADKGLCYAPIDSQIRLTPAGGAGLLATAAASSAPPSATPPSLDAETGEIESSLKGGRFIVILPLFFLLGLGLAFTPCVLPMVPILSFIIVGEGAQVRRSRSFVLSATYSVGMAIVYAALGVAAGLAGEGLSAALQNPWVLSAFALLMAGLSLSMFGVYQLQVPASIQTKLINASEKQKAGKLFGVFIMGAISALVVGPCVAAPLASALIYISQTRDVVIGGSALFAMAVGMSVPLLLIGISAGALLPRAGAWMDAIKRFFGVLMLALALWMVAPVIPAAVQMLGWSVLGLGYGAYLLRTVSGRALSKAVGVLFAVIGLVQLLGVASGSRDVLAPLSHFTGEGMKKMAFVRIKSVAELDAMLARSNGKTVMLDFYADWCVSCKEMEKITFSNQNIQQTFADMILLQTDVTANSADDKALLKRFKLFGPPGIIFFDKQGREIQGGRVIGFQDGAKFSRSLAAVTSL